MTDIEVLNALGIEDFRHITKEKVIGLASLLDRMDPEVAKTALEQFPAFADTIVSIAVDYRAALDNIVVNNNEVAMASIDICRKIIDCLEEQVGAAQTLDEKKYYLALIKQLSDDIINIGRECRKSNVEVFGKAGIIVLFMVGILGCTLGVNGLFYPAGNK